MRVVPDDVERYVEIPITADPTPLVRAIGEAGAFAKVRTGGDDHGRISRERSRRAVSGVVSRGRPCRSRRPPACTIRCAGSIR